MQQINKRLKVGIMLTESKLCTESLRNLDTGFTHRHKTRVSRTHETRIRFTDHQRILTWTRDFYINVNKLNHESVRWKRNLKIGKNKLFKIEILILEYMHCISLILNIE